MLNLEPRFSWHIGRRLLTGIYLSPLRSYMRLLGLGFGWRPVGEFVPCSLRAGQRFQVVWRGIRFEALAPTWFQDLQKVRPC